MIVLSTTARRGRSDLADEMTDTVGSATDKGKPFGRDATVAGV